MKNELTSFPDFEIDSERATIYEDEIFSWIEEIVSYGPRKPASDADEKTRAFITAKFTEFGLDVREPEPISVETSLVRDFSLTLKDLGSGEEIEIPTFHIPFPAPTPAEGVEAALVYVGEGDGMDAMDLEGKIVVFDQRTTEQKYDLLKRMFFFYDPEGSVPDDHVQVNQETRHEREIHDAAVAGGAVGMVGLLTGLEWEADAFCPQMNHGVSKQIPGYWAGPGASETMKAWLDRGEIVATMKMDSELGRSETYNVWATLPGEIDEYYIVMGHHDAPFANAVQDATGVAEMLALAKHFSRIAKERPLRRGIIFLAVGAHTLGRLGERDFVEKHKGDILPRAALVVSIEHIGKEFIPQDDLSFKVSDLPATRLMMISGRDSVGGIVKSSILRHDYRRSAIIPQWAIKKITGKARGISGEFYEGGAPVVGILPNPAYIFFKEDTLDTVARDQLVPTVNLVISIIRTADDLPLNQLR